MAGWLIVPVSWCSSGGKGPTVLQESLSQMFCFISFSGSLKVYGALTDIRAFNWMSCTWYPAVCECVCVCAAAAAAVFQALMQINGGSQQADGQPFTSSVCNCATWKKK